MRERHKDLFGRIATFAALNAAYRKAVLGKRRKPGAAAFAANLEINLLHLERQLRDRSWRPGRYVEIAVTDPKPRNLHDGWNLVTTNMQGSVRSFFILAGDVKPQKKPGYDGSEIPKGKPNPKNAGAPK